MGLVASLFAATSPASGDDLVLGSVYGTITGADGQPIAGAVVVPYYRGLDGWTQNLTSTVADAEGNYVLTYPIGETFRLEMGIDGYASDFWDDVDTVEQARDIRLTNDAPTRANVDAQLDALGSLAGRVIDEAGVPVVGAAVAAYDDRYELVGSAGTPADGRFKIPDLPPDAYRLQVTIRDNKELAPQWLYGGGDFATATPVVVRPGEAVQGIVAEIGASGRVAGRVRLSSGLPVEEFTKVAAFHRVKDEWHVSGETYTRADGTYEIDGLGRGDYRVGVPGDGTNLPDWHARAVTIDEAMPVHVEEGEVTAGIDFVLDPPGQLGGRVRSDQGAPIAGVDVQLFRRSGATWTSEAWQRGLTKADGSYVINHLGPGTYRVLFGSPGDPHRREFWPNATTFSGATDVVLGRSERLGGIDATLAPASHIRGRITNSAGAPLRTITVIAFVKTATGYRRYASTVSQSDGRYRVAGLEPGRYRLAFVDTHKGSVYYLGEYWNRDGGAGSLARGADIVVPATGGASGINARLVRGATISGRVVEATGWPLLGVHVYRLVKGRWREQQSGTSVLPGGAYSLRLEAGRYRLGFAGKGIEPVEFWNDATRLGLAKTIVLKPGSHVTGVNASIDAADGAEVDVSRVPGWRGRAVVGESLQVDELFLVPEDATARYQWYSGEQRVEGATSRTLRVLPGMVGRRLSVLVTASRAGYQSMRLLLVAEVARQS